MFLFLGEKVISRETRKIGNKMTNFVNFFTNCVTFYLFSGDQKTDEKKVEIGRAKCPKSLPKKISKKIHRSSRMVHGLQYYKDVTRFIDNQG